MKCKSILSYLCASDFYLWLIVLVFLSIAAGPTTRPDSLSTNSSVDEILDALDARGKSLRDFSADVKLTDSDNTTGDSTINTGVVLLQRKGEDDARIRVTFTRKQLGDKIFDVDHQYTLENGLLTERDYQAKQEIVRQVLKPGQKLDLFKLGQGPFPLPLGQKKEDVLEQFDVRKIAPAGDDPPDTVHLQLTPKADTQFAGQFKTIDVWVDLATDMPSRIQTLDVNQTTTRTTDLSDVKINVGMGDKDFAQPVLPDGWDSIREPYGQ
jgi:outer membrane lipoprotein-sorting protein